MGGSFRIPKFHPTAAGDNGPLWKDMPGCGEEAGGRSPFRDVASTFASWTLGKTKEQAQKF